MNLTVVIPYCKKDIPLVTGLLRWIKELGGCLDNDVLFVSAKDATDTKFIPVYHGIFESGRLIAPAFELKDESHPIGPNWMFETAVKELARPFLWLEPDAVPLRKDWIKIIESEYSIALANGKSILADVVELNDSKFPSKIPSGVAVYPADAKKIYGALQLNRKIAWDVQFADKVMPQVHKAKTIHNIVNHKQPPVFVAERNAIKNGVLTPGDIRHNAALFHPSKDGSLIELLRSKLNPKSAVEILTEWKTSKKSSINLTVAPPRNRYIHCVERHDYGNHSANDRVLKAFHSWVKVYKTGDVIPCHIWDSDRTAASIGDQRRLPYLKDVLVEGMTAAKKDDDVIVLTNDDTVFHGDILTAMDKKLAKWDATGSMRLNFHELPPDTVSIDAVRSAGKIDLGRDLMAFRKRWLVKHWHSIPDFLLGEMEWDIVLTCLIRRGTGVFTDRLNITKPLLACEMDYGYVLHQIHEREWTKMSNFDSPAKCHNRNLAKKWYLENEMESMVQD